MTIASYKPSEIRKFIVGLVGAITLLVIQALEEFAEFIPANVAGWLTVGVGFATAVGVYLTKNAAVIDSLDEYRGIELPADGVEREVDLD